MKIVILDGYTANPGDVSWKQLKKIGELTVYDRTRPEETAINNVKAFVNKHPLNAICYGLT